MLQDILQVQSAPITSLKLTHLVGLMDFTQSEVRKFFNQEGTSWPQKVKTQFAAFAAAWQRLDQAYNADRYSLDTPELAAADTQCDRIYMGMKKVVDGWLHFDFNSEQKQQAQQLKLSMDNYDINVAEDYLGENNKLRQWIDDVETNYQLEKAMKALGLEATLAQLKTQVQQVRDILTRRGMAKPTKGEMRQARLAAEEQYRWLIAIMNAVALCADNEHLYDQLFVTLNQNIDYLKNRVLPRQGGSAPDTPDTPDSPSTPETPGDEGGSSDTPSQGGDTPAPDNDASTVPGGED